MLWETACPLFDDGQLSFEYCEFVVVMAHPPDSLAPPLIKSWLWACQSHITPALKRLHWLPIKFRITFKVATLMYNIFHQRSPPYLKDLVAFSPSAHQRQLWSSTTRSAVVRRTRTQFGRRAFSVSGPGVWNSLPTDIRLIIVLTHNLLSDAH